MPGEEIITIVNNSGKVISTGRQLMGIFKDAKATYRERKEAAKAERDFNNGSYSSGRSRGQVHITVPRGGRGYDEYDSRGPTKKLDGRKLLGDSSGRRKSHDDDNRSFASRHTSASRTKSHRKRSSSQAPTPSTALTVDNLKTYTEISATAPSKPPKGYTKDLELAAAGGRPTLNHANTMPASPTFDVAASKSRSSRNPFNRRQSEQAPPSSSSRNKNSGGRDRDHDLAYGDLPPDLHLRDDLNRGGGRHRSSHDNHFYPVPPQGIPAFAPDFSSSSPPPPPQEPEQKQALDLISRIESFLLEAHCLQASASCMIENLQQNPEAAAAVALSLAELSAIIGKMSPAFLAFLKGGSPAIYALLCSPQFLIGTGIAAGVMVVMFGGWKIIRRITQGNAKQKEAAVEMNAVSGNGAGGEMGAMGFNAGARAGAAAAGGHDDALVLDDDLSTIECWRRGIVVTGEEEAEVELRSPEADKALRQKYKEEAVHVELSPDDSVSQVGLARLRTTVNRPSGLRERLRDAVGGHSDKSDKERDAKDKEKTSSSSSRRHRDDLDIPDRKSSSRTDKKDKDKATSSSEVGAASSQVSYRSSRSHRASTRSEAGGGGSSSRSKLDREREKDTKDRERKSTSSRVGTSSSKEVNLDDGDSGKKKSNMIKSLFKKMKDKEDEKIATSTKEREREREERRDRDRERERERERDGGKERRISKEGHGERHVRRPASVAN
ncbi:hypothetical protein QBC32DRAFT_364833 [Pseudoneurospora amorphoporcata]|uniref:Uncharacterized protein n=1 Tax=Pseudoneurospora amorphoporcata TaxID=241081 RepID=A0AAN6NPM5_9PEZI|nr:hypothetical protein QBC32DRAFT_364833 [Pseudoneurospora amorphoporcata]